MVRKNTTAMRRKARLVRRRKGLRKPRVTKGLKKVIQNEISRAAQNKEVRNSGDTDMFSFPGSAQGAPPNSWSQRNIFDTSVVYSGLTQGTGEGNIIGNRLKIKKFRFSFIINPAVQITTPMLVRMYVLTYKFDPVNATANDIWSTAQNWSTSGGVNKTFFDNGSSSNGMTGKLQDLLMPINTNVYAVHKVKTYKLGYSALPFTGSEVVTGNNDFKYLIRGSVDLAKYHRKILNYNDATTVNYNKKVFIVYQILSADGGDDNDLTQRCHIYYNYHFVYESF